MAETYHVPNWLQLLVQTAHCVPLRYLQNLVASRSQSETLTYDVSADQVWDLR